MSNESDRRAPGAARVPFDGLVEVGGALGPSFEAQAVDLSGEGMHLRTAYLPEIGQPVTCRFDAGGGVQFVAAGEVLWREEEGDGGEFGIRFTNLDGASAMALDRLLSAEPGDPPDAAVGAKVRLHIDGLASPMRARVKDSLGPMVTAFSELGFLQMGKPLDLEDASSGVKRPAVIDRVAVEVEPESRVPQLVVTLLYDDPAGRAARERREEPVIHMPDPAPHAAEVAPAEDMAMHEVAHEPPVEEAPIATSFGSRVALAKDAEPEEEASPEPMAKIKGVIARGATKIGPGLSALATRAKTTVALLASKRGGSEEASAPVRRTTAPPPDGALHASGRKVVRESSPAHDVEPAEKPKFKVNKKRAVAIGAVGIAAILAGVALRKPATPAPAAAQAPTVATATVAAATLPAAPAETAPPAQPAMPSPFANGADPMAGADMDGDEPSTESASPGKKGKPASFGNGPVGKGIVLRLKMDGKIDRILGATQPTGFAVVVPGRKSVDAAGSLASRDERIASMDVTNEGSGAQLTVAFKDGVPNYQVRAKGSTLEIVLAKPVGDARAKATTHKKKRRNRHH